jgi:hypothetical protein
MAATPNSQMATGRDLDPANDAGGAIDAAPTVRPII